MRLTEDDMVVVTEVVANRARVTEVVADKAWLPIGQKRAKLHGNSYWVAAGRRGWSQNVGHLRWWSTMFGQLLVGK